MGDRDGDGGVDRAVGASLDNDGGPARGAVWVLFLNRDGTVKTHQKVGSTQGGFPGTLDRNDHFGIFLTSWGALDGAGVVDLAVGASSDDDGGTNRGAVWVRFLDGPVDSDGDGVPDNLDVCPNANLRLTVVINGCESEVETTLFTRGVNTGCPIADLVNDALATGGEDALEDLLENLEDRDTLTGG